MGNKQLYRDLLAQFATKQDDAAVQISAAIENGDLKLAKRIAHTVKGVAGNLGIGQVFSAAEKLETAIRDAHPIDPALLEEFSLVLSRQVRAIREGMRDVMPGWPTDLERSRLDGLSTAISEFDFDAALLKLDEIAETCGNMPNRIP